MPSETFILKNRMREIRSYGSVRGRGREAPVYSEVYGPALGQFFTRDPLGYVDGMGLYAGRFAEQLGRDPQGTKIEWVTSARESTVWRSDERCDVAVGTYDAGYAGLDARVRHRRAVLFARPDYFLILDELDGEGTHTYEALFHFMPYRVLVDPSTRSVRSCPARWSRCRTEGTGSTRWSGRAHTAACLTARARPRT
jgi:hypothetical protein